MKKHFYLISILVFVVCCVGVYFAVDSYIENKRAKLYHEICDPIFKALRDGPSRKLFGIASSNGKLEYEKMPIVKKYSEESVLSSEAVKELTDRRNADYAETWEDMFGDIYKMYKVTKIPWGFECLSMDYSYDGNYAHPYVLQEYIYPCAVGYKKQEHSYMYDWAPSVERVIDDAYEYWTTDKSTYLSPLVNTKSVMDEIWSNCYNEYYHLRRYERKEEKVWKTASYYVDEEKRKGNYYSWWYYTGYVAVYCAKTQPDITKVEFRAEDMENDKTRKLFIWYSILVALFIAVLVYHNNKLAKEKQIELQVEKEKNETLKEKLTRLCNPKNFIENYDKEKVEKSNVLYPQILNCESDEELYRLADLAVKDLGVNLINSAKLEELIKKSNPQNFMDPYQPEKVSIANELFAKLKEGNLSFKEFEDLEKKVNDFIS